jgi:hypothetical protein
MRRRKGARVINLLSDRAVVFAPVAVNQTCVCFNPMVDAGAMRLSVPVKVKKLGKEIKVNVHEV